ncbi:MAG: D-glycero-beta-D-manno-heptose-7-phosphate kinase [Lentisphaerae bacterium]|nr:D-glycero-beta-D-manno-heptose-7-phosphate kinase [Lentisphaerota bacterium]
MDNSHLAALLGTFSNARIAVLGDLMIDSYVWGQVERISPEAPVPVVQVTKTSCCLGGAANVMRNIVTLGGQVDAFGLVGDDSNGELIRQLLGEYNIDTSGVITDPERPSIRKERVIAGSQQLLRIDYETPTAASEDLRRKVVEKVKKHLQSGQVQALVLEDYAKGLFSEAMAQELIDCANALGVITVLDPNPRNLMHLTGLTVMKPNRNEAFAMANIPQTPQQGDAASDKSLQQVAKVLSQNWQVKYLLISLAAQGMALFNADGSCRVIPTRASEVYDVSGAGDTVVAASTLALAAGADAVAAAELANYAAGVVVRKLGTATVNAEELRDILLKG